MRLLCRTRSRDMTLVLAFAVVCTLSADRCQWDWCASKSTELFTLFCEFGETRTELESAVHIVFELGKQEPLPKELFALFCTRVSESDAFTASTSVLCNTHNTRNSLVHKISLAAHACLSKLTRHRERLWSRVTSKRRTVSDPLLTTSTNESKPMSFTTPRTTSTSADFFVRARRTEHLPPPNLPKRHVERSGHHPQR